MSGETISVRCSHCGVRLKYTGNRSRIKCPKCQQTSDIQLPATPCTIPLLPSSGVGSPLDQAAEPAKTSITRTHTTAASESNPEGKLRTLLGNGLAQGLIAAGVLYVVLPEFGLSGSRLIVVLGGVVAAGYFGLLHQIYGLTTMFSRRAFATAAKEPPAASSTTGTLQADRTTTPSAPKASPVPPCDPEESAESEPGSGSLMTFIASIAFAAASAVVFSMLKPVLGMYGISIALAVAGAALLTYLLILHVVVAGTRPEARPAAKVRLRLKTRAGLAALGLFACYVGAESTGPEQGLARHLAARATSRMKEPPAIATTIPMEIPDGEDVWGKAHFILANPGHSAVALRNEGTDGGAPYRVIAKATDAEMIRGLRVAWNLRSPVIGNDPALTRKVYADARVNQLMDDNLSRAVSSLLKPREWLPSESALFAFVDARSGQDRIGHLLSSFIDN